MAAKAYGVILYFYEKKTKFQCQVKISPNVSARRNLEYNVVILLARKQKPNNQLAQSF